MEEGQEKERGGAGEEAGWGKRGGGVGQERRWGWGKRGGDNKSYGYIDNSYI